jgi:hypothetical protein
VVHILIVLRLIEKNRIVGCLVEEWRIGEVEQNCGASVRIAHQVLKGVLELEWIPCIC